MSTSVKVFRSTDPGALTLSATAGALLGLFNACLVDGHGAGAVQTLAVVSGIATATYASGHPFAVGSVALIAGATPAGLNGEKRILSATAISVTFAAPGIADGAASGSITSKLAPAGWSRAFTGTNLAAYKSIDQMSTGMILRVDDSGTTQARVVGYELMTDINTGAGLFPSSAQMSGGGYWGKSAVASAAPVQWVLIADARKFYLHVALYSSTSGAFTGGVTYGFGDDIAYRPGGDAYACSLSYGSADIASQHVGAPDAAFALQHAMPRAYTGLGSSALHGPLPFTGLNALSGCDAALGAFPSPVDGGLRLSKKYLATAGNTAPRCELPGLYHVPMSAAFDTFKTRDTIPGTGTLAGRTLMALNPSTAYTTAPVSTTTGVSFFDMTGPWR